MAELTLTESGYAELQLAFELLALELADWHREFEKLEPESTVVIQTRFEQEGPGWLQLSTVYAAQKAQAFPGKTILRREDNLFHSFEKGQTGNIARIGPVSAEFGSDISYGIYHQEKRPIIQISGQDEERFLSIALPEKSQRIRELGFEVN